MAGPITLSKAQFLATPVGKKQGSSYDSYLSYIAKARQGAGSTTAPAADPYTSIIAGLQQPYTPAQIQTQAQGQISPLVAAITKQIQGQTAAATNAITGYSQDAANKLRAINFGAPYAQAETGQAAVDDALRQSLSGAGTTDAAALSQRLAVLNDPSVAAAATGLTANGAANANTQLAQGSASLGNLLANAAAAKNYGQQLPGISNLAGLQQIAAAQQQGVSQIGTQTQQLESQLPSIIQGLQSQNDSRAQAITAARENQVARQDAISSTAASNASKVSVAQIAAQTKATEDEVKQAQSDRTYALQFAKTYHVNPVTGQPLAGYMVNAKGQIVKQTSAPKPKTLTTAQASNYRGLAQTIAENARDGFTTTDKNGTATQHPKLNRQQAIDEARKEGVPDSISIPIINRVYRDVEPATNPNVQGPPAP